MMTGLPLGGVYSVRAVKRSPDRKAAISGLVLFIVALLGIAAILAVLALD